MKNKIKLSVFLLILLLVLYIVLFKKIMIKNNIIKKINQYKKADNYYCKIITSFDGNKSQDEYWYKNGDMIHKKNSYDGSIIVEYIRKSENILYTFNFFDEKLILINETEYIKDNRRNKDKLDVLLNDLENILRNNKIKIMKLKNINNIECYQIKDTKTNDILFIEKGTGLLLRKENKYQKVDYSLKFNCVNQDIFEEYKMITEEEK